MFVIHRRFTVFLLTLPVLMLLGWLLVEQLPALTSPVPAWLQPSNPAAALGACEALGSLNAYGGRFSQDTQAATITPDEARALADNAAITYFGLPAGSSYTTTAGPALANATFPGVGERLTWLNIALLPADPDTRLNKAAIVYHDARSGDLLALVAATSVTSPAEACGGPPSSRRVLLRQYLPLIALGGYLVLVVAGYGVVRWRQRRRAAFNGQLSAKKRTV